MGRENVKNIQKTNKLCYWRKKTWRSSQDSNLHESSELQSDALTKKYLSNFVIVWGGNLKLPPLKALKKKKNTVLTSKILTLCHGNCVLREGLCDIPLAPI